jgi:hypothetical protein
MVDCKINNKQISLITKPYENTTYYYLLTPFFIFL